MSDWPEEKRFPFNARDRARISPSEPSALEHRYTPCILLSPGTRLGPYEILSALGAGGMGEVYRARDAKLNRDVALKVLPESLAGDPDRLARFRREAQVLAALNHPNIGHIYGFEDSGATHALVLELIEGPTLAERIADGPIPLDEALAIARQIADALEAAHEHGVMHRDLKPANVKVREDGTVKVLDFGLAKALDPVSASSSEAMNSPTLMATQLGVIIGTAAYMAPEQARGKGTDRRADIWAFGVVLYEMLTGRRPFDGETVTDVMASIVQREPDWSRLPSGTPPRVHRLLRRCLEKDVKRRIRDIGDARLDIVDTIEAKPDIGVGAAARPSPPRGRWLMGWAMLATIAFLVLAGARWLRPPPPSARTVSRLDVLTPSTPDPTVFAVSPDGRQIVFTAQAQGDVWRLWIRSLDQPTARPVSGTEDGTQPFWSPDGRGFGFFASGHLKRLDIATGLVQTLANAGAPRGGTWSRQGVIVFAPGATSGLMRITASGGQPSPVTKLLPKQYTHRWPQFLPDGNRFLFSTFLGPPETRGLFVASLDAGEPRRLLSGDEIGDSAPLYAPSGVLLTVGRGVLFARRFDPEHLVVTGEPEPIAHGVASENAMFRAAMSVSANGVLVHRGGGAEQRQLVWMDRTGRVLGRVGPPDDRGLAYPSLSRDGRRVVVSRAIDSGSDIWLLDVNRGAFSRLTSDPGNDIGPLWSPDGAQIVFRSSRTGSFDLFVKTLSGAAEERPLVVDGRMKAPMDWSADGGVVLYVVLDPVTGADLWAAPVVGERKPYPVLDTSFDEMDAHFSPDGRWIVYRSNESGRFEIYIRPFPGPGGSQLVSTAGGQYPRWHPNGQELFYVAPDGQMMSVPLDLSANRQSIASRSPVALFPIHLASGSYITSAGSAGRAQYDIAHDGRFLINVAVEGYVPPPLSIVLNWDALLKK
ncbi:MAG TPA: protein kinase [Vicinamibacterales bacterium]|nr:protein kinase [Vicinamibacterales bacterium]